MMDDLDSLRTRTKVPKKRLFDGRTILILSWGTVLALGVIGYNIWQNRTPDAVPASLSGKVLRDTANRLRGAGVNNRAADLLANYLLHETMTDEQRAQLAYTAASLYLDDGNYEQALAYLYLADESNPPGSLKGDIAAKIVTSLEGLKKLGAARYALKTTTALDGQEQIKRGGKLFAKVGTAEISVAEIEQALADLPPQMAAQISGADQKMAFARAYVAEQLLERKALRQKLDEDPAVRRQLTALTRQVVVQKLLQNELSSRGNIEEDDVKNYYEAHKEQFKDKDGQQIPYENVKEQVAKIYMSEKFQKVYAQLLEEALAVEDAKFFPENLGD